MRLSTYTRSHDGDHEAEEKVNRVGNLPNIRLRKEVKTHRSKLIPCSRAGAFGTSSPQ